MFVVMTALAASPAACALGPCLTYQACEQWPMTANEKKKCLEKYFCLIPLSQNVLPFIFSSYFGLNSGAQIMDCKQGDGVKKDPCQLLILLLMQEKPFMPT